MLDGANGDDFEGIKEGNWENVNLEKRMKIEKVEINGERVDDRHYGKMEENRKIKHPGELKGP